MRRNIIIVIVTIFSAFYAVSTGYGGTEVSVGQKFRLEKGKVIEIVGADKKLVIVGKDFHVIPYGVAGGVFVLYDVVYGDTVIKGDGRSRISFSDIPYDFIVEKSDYKTYAEMIVQDPVKQCEKLKWRCDYQRLAIELRKPEFCKKSTDSLSQDYCIEHYVEATNENYLCRLVKDPIMICGYLKAVEENNPNLCINNITWDFSLKCYQEIAKKQGLGEAICDNLDANLKHEIEMCHESFKSK